MKKETKTIKSINMFNKINKPWDERLIDWFCGLSNFTMNVIVFICTLMFMAAFAYSMTTLMFRGL